MGVRGSHHEEEDQESKLPQSRVRHPEPCGHRGLCCHGVRGGPHVPGLLTPGICFHRDAPQRHGSRGGSARSPAGSYFLHCWPERHTGCLLLPADLRGDARHHPGVPAGQSQQEAPPQQSQVWEIQRVWPAVSFLPCLLQAWMMWNWIMFQVKRMRESKNTSFSSSSSASKTRKTEQEKAKARKLRKEQEDRESDLPEVDQDAKKTK